MPVKIEPGTETAKILAKFEQFPTAYTDEENPPGNPYRYREYPKMLYRAAVRGDGRIVCLEPQPMPRAGGTQADAQYQFELLQWQRQQDACCRTVRSADEQAGAEADGWRDSPAAALAFQDGLQQDIAKAAAEAAYAAERMTSKAQAERTAREKASSKHVTE